MDILHLVSNQTMTLTLMTSFSCTDHYFVKLVSLGRQELLDQLKLDDIFPFLGILLVEQENQHLCAH